MPLQGTMKGDFIVPPHPLSFPKPRPSPRGGETVTCSTQNFSLQLTVLLWQNLSLSI